MVTKLNKKSSFLLGGLLLLVLLPIGLHGNHHIMHLLILCFIWGVAASAWNLILGHAGVFSFGQIAFFAVGAYTSGILAAQFGISPWIGIPTGGIVTAVVGILIGLACLKLAGLYVAIATFGLHLVFPTLLMYGGPFATGGSYGLTGIPSPQIGGYIFSSYELVPWYYFALAIFILLIFVIYKSIYSSFGLAFIALRDAGPFAESLGINEYKYKLIMFGVSAFLTGIIGAFYVHYIGAVSPGIFGLNTFLLVFIMVLIGGVGRFPGAVIGAFVITFLNDFLLVTGLFRFLIFGAIVVAVTIYLPQGLMGIPESFNHLIRRAFKRELAEEGGKGKSLS